MRSRPQVFRLRKAASAHLRKSETVQRASAAGGGADADPRKANEGGKFNGRNEMALESLGIVDRNDVVVPGGNVTPGWAQIRGVFHIALGRAEPSLLYNFGKHR